MAEVLIRHVYSALLVL